MGPQTQYGQALGSMQVLPSTAQGVAKRLGVPFRPDLLSGTTPEAAFYQQAIGNGYLGEAVANTTNPYDAARYYHGGPNRRLWGPKTNAYARKVTGLLG